MISCSLLIEFLIVFNTVEVMTLHHPLDVKRGYRHCERIVVQYRSRDCLGWSNDVAQRAKSVFKFHSKAFEELNVFRFFTRKSQQRANAVIVPTQLWTSMIEYEWQNEFFYESEDAEVCIASDLIKNSFLFF